MCCLKGSPLQVLRLNLEESFSKLRGQLHQSGTIVEKATGYRKFFLKVIVGGAPTSQDFAAEMGANALRWNFRL